MSEPGLSTSDGNQRRQCKTLEYTVRSSSPRLYDLGLLAVAWVRKVPYGHNCRKIHLMDLVVAGIRAGRRQGSR